MIPQTSANDAKNGWGIYETVRNLYNDAQEWSVILINGAIIICQILHAYTRDPLVPLGILNLFSIRVGFILES